MPGTWRCTARRWRCGLRAMGSVGGPAPGWGDALRVYSRKPVLVISLLGFSAGLPFLLVFSTLTAWLRDEGVAMYGVEAGGEGLATGRHAAPLSAGSPGVLHGNRTYLLQTDDGQILDAHSISAGLDYPGIGPEHAFLRDTGRAEYLSTTDKEALEAFQLCTKLEGIIPALEPSHALARVGEVAQELGPDGLIILNMCGRGDKDVFSVAKHLGVDM